MYSEKFSNLLSPLVQSLGYDLIGAEFVPHRGNALLRLYVDVADRGVTVEDCERVSREVEGLLDVENLIPGRYTLEVSSPGLDRPLYTLAHFLRWQGADVDVTLIEPVAGRRRWRGRIDKIEGEQIEIQAVDAAAQFNFRQVAKARLVPNYQVAMSSGKHKA